MYVVNKQIHPFLCLSELTYSSPLCRMNQRKSSFYLKIIFHTIEIYSLCYSDDNSMYVEESKDTTLLWTLIRLCTIDCWISSGFIFFFIKIHFLEEVQIMKLNLFQSPHNVTVEIVSLKTQVIKTLMRHIPE